MSDDPMEYIRSERRFAKFFTGADPTPNELATQFLKLGPQERATALNDLGKKIDNPVCQCRSNEQASCMLIVAP